MALSTIRYTTFKKALQDKKETGYLIDGKSIFVFTRLSIEDWVLVHPYPVRMHLKLVR